MTSIITDWTNPGTYAKQDIVIAVHHTKRGTVEEITARRPIEPEVWTYSSITRTGHVYECAGLGTDGIVHRVADSIGAIIPRLVCWHDGITHEWFYEPTDDALTDLQAQRMWENQPHVFCAVNDTAGEQKDFRRMSPNDILTMIGAS